MKLKIILALAGVGLILSGCGVAPSVSCSPAPVVLNYWRVSDSTDAFQPIIDDYVKLHPYVTINYKLLREDEYEQQLLEALAEDRGPDILSINSSWLRKYQSKLAPMPDSMTTVVPYMTGTIKKVQACDVQVRPGIKMQDLKNNFVDTVYNDVVIQELDEASKQLKNKVYGLPLSVDTLATYYNKDLLNAGGVINVPAYWGEEMVDAVKKLTKQDATGKITQAALGLGNGANVEHSADILAALMMQNGAVMQDGETITFNQTPNNFNKATNPGMDAVKYYTNFANPGGLYTYNSTLDNSLEMFIDGRLAIMFGYAYDLPAIQSRAQAAKLNFGISEFPQIDPRNPKVNVANYWLETVSRKSKHVNEAWDFVLFATGATEAQKYLDATKKPAALRSILSQQVSSDNSVSIFANQLLTAKSWYRGKDPQSAERFMAEMIDQAAANPDQLEAIVNLAASKIQQTVQ